MRVKLKEDDLTRLFSSNSSSEMARILGVSARTINDWKRGKFLIPEEHFKVLQEKSGHILESFSPEYREDHWHNSIAGKRGGRAYFEKYGSLGTHESRRDAGRKSFEKRKSRPKDIYSRKVVKLPDLSEELAEFLGIMIGDGNITKYQASIALSSLVDAAYADYVETLIYQLFAVKIKRTIRGDANCLIITISSVELTEYLRSLGLPLGDKIKQNLDIPGWIREDPGLSLACVRGIFDTDGCVFLETHTIKGKKYSYPRWSLVSASARLRESVFEILYLEDFDPRLRNGRSVNLERLTDVQKYFKVIGSNNPKHLARWEQFGGVA